MESFKEEMNVDQAQAMVMELQQRAMAMGANDFEPSAFAGILRDLTEGTILPQEAVQRAQGILEGKQDYH